MALNHQFCNRISCLRVKSRQAQVSTEWSQMSCQMNSFCEKRTCKSDQSEQSRLSERRGLERLNPWSNGFRHCKNRADAAVYIMRKVFYFLFLFFCWMHVNLLQETSKTKLRSFKIELKSHFKFCLHMHTKKSLFFCRWWIQ